MLFIYTNNGDYMRKKVLVINSILLLIGLILIGVYAYYKRQEHNRIKEEQELIHDIKSHYHSFVISIKNAPLYKLVNNKYKKVGFISKDVELSLSKMNQKSKKTYFKIKNENYYIYYKNVHKISSIKQINTRFQNYLYFNESLKTKNTFSLYSGNKKDYTFYEPMNFKILIKEENRYGVIYQNKLYYIHKEEISNTYLEENNKLEKAEEIPVTVYHFLYLEGESCNEIICNSIHQVEEEFTYLKENNYFTINTKEMESFIKGEINLPKRSILITIDDGAKATNFLSILDHYSINATLFLVSSWYPKEDFKSSYLELASHTHNLHTPGICSGGQGSPLKCMEKEKILEDLKTSKKILNNTDAFCFPFYEYNDYAIEIIKEVGFKSAYIGGSRKAKIGENPYTIPRITIHNNIPIDEYIHIIQ